jgi:hypothetical protein
MISLILSTLTRIPFNSTFKHQKRFATINSVCRNIDLKSTLSLILSTFGTFKSNCLITSLGKSLAF